MGTPTALCSSPLPHFGALRARRQVCLPHRAAARRSDTRRPGLRTVRRMATRRFSRAGPRHCRRRAAAPRRSSRSGTRTSRKASQDSQYQEQSLHQLALNISKVNETTLTLAGIATWGIARLVKSPDVADVALHATESVMLASVASQMIRGPLGRTRPNYAGDDRAVRLPSFKGFTAFKYRAFPSIHTSSSMAVATVITLELNRRHQSITPVLAPILFFGGDPARACRASSSTSTGRATSSLARSWACSRATRSRRTATTIRTTGSTGSC